MLAIRYTVRELVASAIVKQLQIWDIPSNIVTVLSEDSITHVGNRVGIHLLRPTEHELADALLVRERDNYPSVYIYI